MMVDEALLSEWRKQQHEVASKVIVLPDDEATIRCFGTHEGSKNIQDNDDPQFISLSIFNEPSSSSSNTSSEIIKDKLIGGVDVSFGKHDCNIAVAVYVVTQNLKVVYTDTMTYKLTQPYVSSYLAFREIEPLTELIQHQMQEKPSVTPEVILVDGNGTWHERRAGIACFVGVRTGIATIGVGKTPYCCDGWTVEMMEGWVNSSIRDLANHCREMDSTSTMNVDIDRESVKDDDSDSSDWTNGVIVQRSTAMDVRSCGDFLAVNNDDDDDDDDDDETTKKGIANSSNVEQMKENIKTISSHCMGYVMMFKGEDGCILGAQLVGHGGKVRASGTSTTGASSTSNYDGQQRQRQHVGRRQPRKNQTQSGTKVPIYVSVGHAISLQRAVVLCAALSLHRIPEPVRQADLIGRQIMREEA